MTSNKKKDRYSEAGVDIDAGNRFVDLIKPIVSKTYKSNVITDIGGFAGLFSLQSKNLNNPVLVSGTDGVGTKLKIAFERGDHSTVGIDLVAMCVNDIVVQGASPLFMLDYISMSRLDIEKSVQSLPKKITPIQAFSVITLFNKSLIVIGDDSHTLHLLDKNGAPIVNSQLER